MLFIWDTMDQLLKDEKAGVTPLEDKEIRKFLKKHKKAEDSEYFWFFS